jgi:hypothetical protein
MNSIRAILRILHALLVPSLKKPVPVRVQYDRNSRRISS